MTTQQIHYFLEAAKCLNFTEASRNLFVAQSTFSKQIAALEREVGVQLFDRTGHGVTLTAAGVLLRVELAMVETNLLLAVDRAQSLSQAESSGHLSVCVLDLLNPETFVAPALRRMQREHPGLLIEVFFCGFKEIRTHITERTVDVAFTKRFETEYTPNVDYLKAYSVTPGIAVNLHSPLAQQPYITFEDVSDQQFVILDSDECPNHTHALWDIYGRLGIIPRVERYAKSNMDRLFFVHQGYGVMMVDCEFPVPPWAHVRVVPNRANMMDMFVGSSVVMEWNKNAANPVIDSFRRIVQEMAWDFSAQEKQTHLHYEP